MTMIFESDPLPDIERKIQRILVNCSFYQKTPSIAELCLWTGREPGGIFEVLKSLANKEYIKWSPEKPEEITLIVQF